MSTGRIKTALYPYFVATMLAGSLSGCSNEADLSRERAQATFLANERIIEHAARLRDVDLNRFDEASRFVNKLTGISVPGDHNLVADWYPTPETAQAIRPLRRWYAANKDRLYWDESAKMVKLRPQ